MVVEGLPVRTCCRVMEVSESGFYAWRSRPPSAGVARRAWLTDMIAQIHAMSNGVYGSPRVHAELRLARGIIVGHGTVEKLMRQAGIKGLPYSRTRLAAAVEVGLIVADEVLVEHRDISASCLKVQMSK
jgi:putative transposase